MGRLKAGLWASIGSVAVAAASSACCWLPLVAVGLGLGAGGAAALLEPYRGWFLGAAAALLGIGFYFDYRREEPCAPDGSCPPQRPLLRRVNRAVLWSSAALVVGFALFPEITRLISTSTGTFASAQQLIRLSADAHELRDAFNRDLGSVRLVALLSPT